MFRKSSRKENAERLAMSSTLNFVDVYLCRLPQLTKFAIQCFHPRSDVGEIIFVKNRSTLFEI